MKCPTSTCDGDVRVTHTYTAGRDAKTQRVVCQKCGQVGTVLVRIVGPAVECGGAAALATQLRRGEAPPG